jgi:hypothetical protein
MHIRNYEHVNRDPKNKVSFMNEISDEEETQNRDWENGRKQTKSYSIHFSPAPPQVPTVRVLV